MLESGLLPGEWVEDASGARGVAWLIEHHAGLGWSTKETSGSGSRSCRENSCSPPPARRRSAPARPVPLLDDRGRRRLRSWSGRPRCGAARCAGCATCATPRAVQSRLRRLPAPQPHLAPDGRPARGVRACSRAPGARWPATGRGHPEPPSAAGADAPQPAQQPRAAHRGGPIPHALPPRRPPGAGWGRRASAHFALESAGRTTSMPPRVPPRAAEHLRPPPGLEPVRVDRPRAGYGGLHPARSWAPGGRRVREHRHHPGLQAGQRGLRRPPIRRHGQGAPCNPASGEKANGVVARDW